MTTSSKRINTSVHNAVTHYIQKFNKMLRKLEENNHKYSDSKSIEKDFRIQNFGTYRIFFRTIPWSCHRS